MKYKSVFISDLHLNNPFCKSEILSNFLKNVDCENLFLIGDIFDFYQKNINFDKNQINVIRKILTKSKRGINVNYIIGNHDAVIRNYLEYDIKIENINICNEFVYETHNKKILISHGDAFDLPIIRELYVLGDFLYITILTINSWYNIFRKNLGLEYYSISQKIKTKVKDAVKFIEDFEHNIVKYVISKKLDAVICGHIHKPEIKIIDNICYMNDGDWVESISFIVEDYCGNFYLKQYINNEFKTIKKYNILENKIYE